MPFAWNYKWVLGSLLVLITLIAYQQTWHLLGAKFTDRRQLLSYKTFDEEGAI
jgi:hypothetical protein